MHQSQWNAWQLKWATLSSISPTNLFPTAIQEIPTGPQHQEEMTVQTLRSVFPTLWSVVVDINQLLFLWLPHFIILWMKDRSQQNHTQCCTALVVEYLCEQITQSKTTQSYSFSLKKKKKKNPSQNKCTECKETAESKNCYVNPPSKKVQSTAWLLKSSFKASPFTDFLYIHKGKNDLQIMYNSVEESKVEESKISW